MCCRCLGPFSFNDANSVCELTSKGKIHLKTRPFNNLVQICYSRVEIIPQCTCESDAENFDFNAVWRIYEHLFAGVVLILAQNESFTSAERPPCFYSCPERTNQTSAFVFLAATRVEGKMQRSRCHTVNFNISQITM